MKEKKNACTGCAAAEADGRFVRHPESADGEAVVTAYPVFPGIEIAYCDIHAHECRLEHTPEAPLMRISHCREGRLEQQLGNEYYFLGAGGSGRFTQRRLRRGRALPHRALSRASP